MEPAALRSTRRSKANIQPSHRNTPRMLLSQGRLALAVELLVGDAERGKQRHNAVGDARGLQPSILRINIRKHERSIRREMVLGRTGIVLDVLGEKRLDKRTR